MTYLHIAQKNSIAKQVSFLLSDGTQRVGNTLSKYNQVYQFYIDQQEHLFSSVRGHIFSKKLPPECNDWKNYDNSLILTRQVPIVRILGEDMDLVVKNIEQLAKKASHLILWLDCDREGEAIAYEVIDVVKNINRNIRINRARFSAVTKADVMAAYSNLVQPNRLEADAVNFRQEIDFRTGCAFTRFQSTALNSFIQMGKDRTVSYGLCQIPTLSLVVDRFLEIRNFKPQKYWVLSCTCVIDDKNGIDFKWTKKNTRDEVQANKVYAQVYRACKNTEGTLVGRVTLRKSVNRKKYRPYPLTTVQFQKLATDKLRMSAANAMKVAESLYQRGFISYPRTETNSFPPTINLQNLLGNLKNSSVYSSYIWSLLENNKFQKPKVGSASDQAHTPIHPVKLAEQNSLNAEQWKVYDLITRHFLACCSADAIGVQSQVHADVGGEMFKASYLTIKQRNYLEIYPFENWTENSFPSEVPEVFPVLLKLQSSETKPPNWLTESELIGLMEKNRIGTDSTIHEHIQTIQTRRYAVKTNNTFKPTNLGASLVKTYRDIGVNLAECQIRRTVEITMNEISEGKSNKEAVTVQALQNFIPIYTRLHSIRSQWSKMMQQSMMEYKDLSQIELLDDNARSVEQKSDNDTNVSRFNPNNQSNKIIQCYSCKEPGHLASNCPKKNSSKPMARVADNNASNSMPPRIKPNAELSLEKSHRNEENYTCFHCNKKGHLAPNCPLKRKENDSGEKSRQKKQKSCESCGQIGRHPRDSKCPNVKRKANKQDSKYQI